MTDTAVRLDILESSDVRADFTTKFALDAEPFDRFAQRVLLRRLKLVRTRPVRDLELIQNFLGARATDAVDGGETDLEPLIVWDCYSGDTHSYPWRCL